MEEGGKEQNCDQIEMDPRKDPGIRNAMQQRDIMRTKGCGMLWIRQSIFELVLYVVCRNMENRFLEFPSG